MQRKIYLLAFALLLLAPQARAQGMCFEGAVNYNVVSGPQSVVAADLDGDGDLDLAVAGYGVMVLKNNGDGTYASAIHYSVGPFPYSISAADLDGDGDQDLAVADLYGGDVYVLKNSGNGTFALAGNYAAGTYPRSVFAADLDGDGDPDLAVANDGSGNVSVLKNKGDGSFVSTVGYTVGLSPQSVVGADLDGDGDLDLAVANAASDHVSILKNNGDGTFASAVNYPVGSAPYSVFAADLNGDGAKDLAVANTGSGNVSLLTNNGDGTFADAVDYAAGFRPFSIFAADLDGDGDLDLAVANNNDGNVSVLTNKGDGTYTSLTNYPVGTGPRSVFAADLNGGGAKDLAVANTGSGSISVLINCRINEAPLAGCQNVTVDADSTCHAQASINNGSHDPRAGNTITLLQVPPAPYPLGQTSVQLIVTNNHGAADTCAATVTVQDTTKPRIVCPADTTFKNNDPGQCGAVVTYALTATDNCSTPTVVYSPASGSFLPVGTTTVRAIATDGAGNEDTCFFVVKVRDVEKPSLTCPGNINVSNDPGQCGAVVNYTAPTVTDNCPGVQFVASASSGSTFPVGTTPVKMIATDASGNKDSCSFNVTVQDTSKPTIACPGDMVVSTDPGRCDAVVTFGPPQGADNCPGVMAVSRPPSGSTFLKRTTKVYWVATDAAGNRDSCNFNVTVNDTEKPKAYCPGDIEVTVPYGQTGVVVSYNCSDTDNCPGVTSASYPGSGSLFPIGATTVTCVATDASGNRDTCTFVVRVNCSCPHQGDIDGSGSIDVTDVLKVIQIAFTNGAEYFDPGCPRTRGDVNNSGVADVNDVIYIIKTAFTNGPPPVNPCGP